MRRIHAMFSRVVSYMIARLPPSVKRTVILASYAVILNDKIAEEDKVEMFNHEIIRAHELGAVQFAMAISKYVWFDLLDRHHYPSLLSIPDIMQEIPETFFYGHANTLSSDLRKIIVYSKRIV